MLDKFVKQLIRSKFTFFTGVPCSLLAKFLKEIEEYSSKDQAYYVSALREDVAVGLATGAYLAGKKPVVLMQNSGLGVTVNAMASLTIPCAIPILYIISLRGYYPECDTEENRVMGAISLDLLKKLNVKYIFLEKDGEEKAAEWASEQTENGESVAILIKPEHGAF